MTIRPGEFWIAEIPFIGEVVVKDAWDLRIKPQGDRWAIL